MSISNRNTKFISLMFLMLLAMFAIARLSVVEGLTRHLIFISLFTLLFAITAYLKEKVIGFLIVYLAMLGFLRRALIPIAGWNGFDPLLVIGPSISVIIALTIFWEIRKKENIVEHNPDNLMIVLISVGCLHIFNPLSGSPLAGLIASMYIIIPWLWYFISFYRLNSIDIRKIFFVIELVGTVVAIYGIYHSFYGLLSFEMSWVKITGYNAIHLADEAIRSISTFASAQEFVYFTAITFMIACSKVIKGNNKILHVIVMLLSFSAIFLASARTIIFFMAFSVILVLVISRISIITKTLTCAASIAVLYISWLILPLINPNVFGTASHAVEHMIVGLIDPLSEEQTGVGHVERFADGMMTLFQNPVGHGIASITKAADKVANSTAMSTEVDISNMIVAMGVGGIVYLLIISVTIYRAIWLIHYQISTEMIAALGILVASLGQWINGGFYLTPIIIWLLVGWVHKEYVVNRGELDASSSS